MIAVRERIASIETTADLADLLNASQKRLKWDRPGHGRSQGSQTWIKGRGTWKTAAHNNESAKTRTNVTFWGKRIVTVQGFEGSIPLEKLAKKVHTLSQAVYANDNQTLQTRVSGIYLTRLVKHLYEDSDTAAAHANIITRILTFIRDNFFAASRTRPLIETEVADRNFRAYSTETFNATFGEELLRGRQPLAGPPPRHVAEETDLIRVWNAAMRAGQIILQ